MNMNDPKFVDQNYIRSSGYRVMFAAPTFNFILREKERVGLWCVSSNEDGFTTLIDVIIM